MGSSYPKYLTQAFWDWMTLSQLLQDSVGIDALEALLLTPFNFPLRARKNPRLTFSQLNEKYEPLARKLRKIKGQHRDDPIALRHDIHGTLPD
ncbi:MAG: hypothetical protein HYY46_02745 [Deltaproteobacteria bacterium]|nr:hypothetical protein [Deltaproteobacteria bacterium]